MQLETATRNAMLSALATQVATGSTNPTPRIVCRNSSNTTLATLNMSATPFATPTNGSMTANSISSDTNAAASGTLHNFQVFNRDNTLVFSGTITAAGGGGDMTTSRLSVVAGDTVAVGTFTITLPAS